MNKNLISDIALIQLVLFVFCINCFGAGQDKKNEIERYINLIHGMGERTPAMIYNSAGYLYKEACKYDEALLYYDKAVQKNSFNYLLKIRQKFFLYCGGIKKL